MAKFNWGKVHFVNQIIRYRDDPDPNLDEKVARFDREVNYHPESHRKKKYKTTNTRPANKNATAKSTTKKPISKRKRILKTPIVQSPLLVQ